MAKMHSASLGHQQDRRSQNKCLGTQGIFVRGKGLLCTLFSVFQSLFVVLNFGLDEWATRERQATGPLQGPDRSIFNAKGGVDRSCSEK